MGRDYSDFGGGGEGPSGGSYKSSVGERFFSALLPAFWISAAALFLFFPFTFGLGANWIASTFDLTYNQALLAIWGGLFLIIFVGLAREP